jgi:hypothetical protein
MVQCTAKEKSSFDIVMVLEVLDFLMGYESYLRKRRISRSQVGATNRPKNTVICYVSFVSLSSICLNVLDIFHWFIAPPPRRYFQGHSP